MHHWNCISPSKQWYRAIYRNTEWYTQSNFESTLLYNGILQAWSFKEWMPQSHWTNFFNTMYPNFLIPLIYKPTRKTDSTATLIDNIFTNYYDVNDQLYQAIFLMDISDHYDIFHIMDKQCTTNDSSQLLSMLRVINEFRIEKYKDCI